MTPYDAVLLDLDGVLVEPPARATQVAATRDAFAEVGVDEPDADHVDAIVDGVAVEELHELCAAYGVDPETLWAARERHDEWSQLEAFWRRERRAYDDVAACARLPVPVGVASNNHQSTVEFVVEYFGFDWWIDACHGRPKTIESLERRKPDPYRVEAARDALGAESVLFVGDAESDLRAAERAGAAGALLRREHNRDLEPSVEPTHELTSLREVADLVEGPGLADRVQTS